MSKQWLTDTIYVAASTIDNVGIFTSSPILTGETIYQVMGQFVKAEFSEQFSKMGPNWIGISKEVWLDPDPTNPMTFMNHSCEPNAIVTSGLQVVALRPIFAHEEILIDYSTTEIDPYWAMPCTCNSPSCRKSIGPFQLLPPELRRLYSDYMLETLLADAPTESALILNLEVRYE
jgi:hypothetical protein